MFLNNYVTRRSYSVHQLLFHSKKLLYGSVVRIMQTQTISCSKRGTHLGRWYGFTVLNITFILTVCHLVVEPETWDFKKLNIKYVLCLLSPNSYSTATHSWRSCVCGTLDRKGGTRGTKKWMSRQLLQCCASFPYSWLTITPTQEGVWASHGFCIHAQTCYTLHCSFPQTV